MAKDDFKDLLDVSNDDGKPDKDDIQDDEDEQEVDIEELMVGMKTDDEEEESDESEEGGEEEEGSEEEQDEEARFQARLTEELNRIIPERLKRDRKSQEVSYLEQMTGMSLEQIGQQIKQNMIEAKADELGISEEEAKGIVETQLENAGHKAKQKAQQEEQTDTTAAMKLVQYMQDRLNYSKQPKLSRVLSKEVLDEIDAFSQKGAILPFEDAMNWVLGKKLSTGELINKVQNGAAKKAQAQAQTKKSSPQSKSSASASSENALTKQQRLVAASLGITSKEDLAAYAKEVNAENRRKRNRGR